MGLIQYDDVYFQYPNGFSAVEKVCFQIEKGENIAIVGQNGAGKTTAVKMMNGLLKPTGGTVLIDGMDTHKFTAAQLSRKTGYVFQNPDDQIFHDTVLAEIAFGPKVLHFHQEKQDRKVQLAVKLAGLENELNTNPYELPLSIRKFVTIASVIAMDTDILVLDEPTAGQDIRGIIRLEAIIRELLQQGKTLVTITHDMEFVVRNFSKVFVMANKNLLRVATPKEIFADDALLEVSMLKKPYICEISEMLGFGSDALTQAEFVDCVCAKQQKTTKFY